VPAAGRPGADATLDDIALIFRANGVPFDAIMLAAANADTPGMFRDGATLVVDRQIIAAGWTLATNPTGVAAATLAADNIATVDLFAAGTPVFLKTATVAVSVRRRSAPPRAPIAVEPGDLLRHNASLAPLAPTNDGSVGLPVAGLAALPSDPSTLRIPYRIVAGQTMNAIAALFVSAAPSGSPLTAEQALVEANRALPGTVAGGQTITVAARRCRPRPATASTR